MGRDCLALRAVLTIPMPMIGSELAVQETTTSYSCNCFGKSTKGNTSVLKFLSAKVLINSLPRSTVLFEIAIFFGALPAK